MWLTILLGLRCRIEAACGYRQGSAICRVSGLIKEMRTTVPPFRCKERQREAEFSSSGAQFWTQLEGARVFSVNFWERVVGATRGGIKLLKMRESEYQQPGPMGSLPTYLDSCQ